jgi:hypothetical protein
MTSPPENAYLCIRVAAPDPAVASSPRPDP